MINYSVLKDISRLKKYLSGSPIYEDADKAEFHIVLKGDVGLFSADGNGGRELTETIGPGGFFGEGAFAPGKGLRQSAVALTDIIAVPVGCADAAAFVREEPELATELIKALCERVCTLQDVRDKTASRMPAASPAAPQAASHTAAAPNAPAAPKAAAAPAAKPKPADPAPAPAPSGASPLFPDGHGSYTLDLHTDDRTYLMESQQTCPICKKEFAALKARASRLQVESVDPDMRNRYRGIEPIYYDVVTCPHCLYSALVDQFKAPDMPKADLSELKAYKSIKLQTGANLDTFSVFASYYLALICAPKCFTSHSAAVPKLLLKLSRIYQDCKDRQMEESISRRALEAYTQFYINENSTAEMDQQLCLIIGELHLKLGDIKNARDFFFKVKINREGSQVFKTQAENRLGEIRGA